MGKPKENAFDLAEYPLFSGLSAEEAREFVAKTKSVIRSYEKGNRILRAYESNAFIGMMLEGRAQIIAEDRFGNESIGHTLERGALFGIVSAILGPDYAFTSVAAKNKTAALLIPYRELLLSGMKLGRVHGIVMKNLLTSFSLKAVLMMQKIELLSHKSLRDRLTLYLIQQSDRQKSDRVTVPSKMQLAKALECNRSALVREISAMSRARLLRCGDDWMELDTSALAKASK
ncbi:MAG: Crp/Fnr family transcriptional regulator [Schwartzia sp.]|nr:Crp/Fnr family transcriptional regulator [Schwartzia sp. (in: firmicutes)]